MKTCSCVYLCHFKLKVFINQLTKTKSYPFLVCTFNGVLLESSLMCDFFLRFILKIYHNLNLKERMRLSSYCTDQNLDQIQASKMGFSWLVETQILPLFWMTFNTLLHAKFFILNTRSIYFLKKKELDTNTQPLTNS